MGGRPLLPPQRKEEEGRGRKGMGNTMSPTAPSPWFFSFPNNLAQGNGSSNLYHIDNQHATMGHETVATPHLLSFGSPCLILVDDSHARDRRTGSHAEGCYHCRQPTWDSTLFMLTGPRSSPARASHAPLRRTCDTPTGADAMTFNDSIKHVPAGRMEEDANWLFRRALSVQQSGRASLYRSGAVLTRLFVSPRHRRAINSPYLAGRHHYTANASPHRREFSDGERRELPDPVVEGSTLRHHHDRLSSGRLFERRKPSHTGNLVHALPLASVSLCIPLFSKRRGGM